MRDYYDVMYSESYDWWHLVLAFPLSPQQQEEISKYSFDGVEDLGVDVSIYGERAVVNIFCCLKLLDPDYADELWESLDEEDDEEGNTLADGLEADPLLLLLVKIRRQLMEGDYRALYEVWKKYGYPEDEEDEEDEDEWPSPPIPTEKDTGKRVIAEFAEMLDLI